MSSIRLARDPNRGWVSIADTQYTDVAPFSITSGNEVTLPNNGATVIDTFKPVDVTSFINANKFTPNNVGDFYSFRLQFTCNPTLNNRNLTVSLDIGPSGTPIIIWSKTERLARGAGNDTRVSIAIPLFTLDTFVANGGMFSVLCDGDCDIFNISWLIERGYKS